MNVNAPEFQTISISRHLINKVIQEQSISLTELPLKDLDQIENTLRQHLSETINLMSRFALLEFFQSLKTEKIILATAPEEQLSRFCELMQQNKYVTEFFLKYPVLQGRITDLVVKSFTETEVILNRLIHDAADLQSAFSVIATEVKSVVLGAGDQHDGETVSILTFSDKKIVYKPRGSMNELFFNNLYNSCFEGNDDSGNVVPNNINFNEYSWHQFTQTVPPSSLEDVDSFFGKCGKALSLFYLLGTTDMHFENIKFVSNHPSFIDMETLYRARLEGNYSFDNKEISASVLNTALIPVVDRSSGLDINLSGLFNGKQESSELTYNDVVFDRLANNWTVTKTTSSFVPPSLIPEIERDYDTSTRGFNSFISGFKYGMNYILTHRDTISRVINSSISDTVSRQILRPTRVYSKFIDAALLPKYLVSPDKQSELFDILEEQFKPGTYGYLRVEKEITDLSQWNIPIFFTSCSSRNLLTTGGKNVVSNYFSESPLDTINERLTNLDSNMIDYQTRLVEMSLASTIPANTLFNYPLHVEKKSDTSKHLENLDSYLFNTSDDSIDYYDFRISDNRLSIDLTSPDIYYGNGILLRSLCRYYRTRDSNNLHQANLLFNDFSTKILYLLKSGQTSVDWGVFSGVWGSAYVAALIFQETQNDSLLEYINEISKGYDKFAKVDSMDYLTGTSGIITLLSKLYKYLGDSFILPERYQNDIDVLVNDVISEKFNLKDPSLGHGYTGVLLALNHVKELPQCDVVVDQAITKLVSLLASSFTDIEKMGWCDGKAGILCAVSDLRESKFSHTMSHSKDFIDSLQKSVRNRINFKREINGTLCHGLPGEIASLIYAQRKGLAVLDTDVLEDIVRFSNTSYARKVLSSLTLNSFMLGDTGRGYLHDYQNSSTVPNIPMLQFIV